MQATNNIYKEILNTPGHKKEHRVFIGGIEQKIIKKAETRHRSIGAAPTVTGGLFGKNHPTVGNCVARQIDLIVKPESEIPRMAEIRLETRLVLQNAEGDALASEWLPKGTFFIDTRQKDTSSGALVIHGYDAMLKAEQQYIPTDSESTSWPRKMPAVVADICYRLGVELDERSIINDWDVQYPGDFTMREILGYIAACHAGNWTITDAGKLRLVSLSGNADFIDIGNLAASLDVSSAFEPFTGVQFHYDGKDTFSAAGEVEAVLTSSDGYALQDSNGVNLAPVDGGGTVDGRTLEIETPWATQEIADAAMAAVKGYMYQPYEAAGAILDPAAELGDTLSVGGVTGPIAAVTTTFDALCSSNVSAPSDQEVDHEYPYENRSQRQTRREVAKATASLRVGVDEIVGKVEGIEDDVSSVTQKVDSIKMEVKQSSSSDGQTYASITLRVGEEMYTGQILLDGNVNVSGQLSADALYSALGDIADLTVDRLSSSRRIVKYLAGDQSDDNYITAVDESLSFISGVYKGGEEQAVNPNGLEIYWESNPNASGVSIGTDGYPYKDGVRIFTTTEETNYPVMVYTYDELVKAKFAFEMWGDIYTPVLTMGAGNAQGLNKGFITKSADGLEIVYKANTGADIGMRLGTGGYMDLTGLRKPTNIAFTNEGFTVTVDGGLSESFNYIHNANGTISGIVDSTGHVTAVSGVSV